MTIRALRNGRRRGAVTVETALVMMLLLTCVLGVFEFGRLLMDWNVLNNAAREGCRYALANNTSTTISTDVQTIVTNFMGGEIASFSNFTVTVSGTHQGVATAVNSLSAGDMITVTVSGTYKFMNIIPIIKMPTSFTISCAVTMGCEGAT
jgi:Flp pilus assembly protein TadG